MFCAGIKNSTAKYFGEYGAINVEIQGISMSNFISTERKCQCTDIHVRNVAAH